MKNSNPHIFIVLVIFFLFSCRNSSQNDNNDIVIKAPDEISYSIVSIYPHDTSFYTQGLVLNKDTIFESTGLFGKSRIRKSSMKNGKLIEEIKINNDSIFGEGITIFDKKIYQLTWKNNKVYLYDANTLKIIKEYIWPYEGWGITHDAENLIISTGSNKLFFVDPKTFKVINIISVFDKNGIVEDLNELEYIGGYVYANKYMTDTILKINTGTGQVVGVLNMKGLLSKSGVFYDREKYDNATGNVLNGIAFDSTKNSLLITGKLWPAIFEIKLN